MGHKRGDHSDDPSDTERCDCEDKVHMFRHGDSIYVDIGPKQYVLSLEKILSLEDMSKRSNQTAG